MPPTNVRKMLDRAEARLLKQRGKLDAELAIIARAKGAPRRGQRRKKGKTR